ncbi:hypothetical protein FRZ44_51680 [Hypericibacter terrae]|uniref:Uncharacterized protein n=1 Tax=Hypericibacter terrae TaxID=2602015 RepID=A0A5J6MR96_9PROT|nr:hypothetical protein FRZ44_51680 [Hypericibacter terrae]
MSTGFNDTRALPFPFLSTRKAGGEDQGEGGLTAREMSKGVALSCDDPPHPALSPSEEGERKVKSPYRLAGANPLARGRL